MNLPPFLAALNEVDRHTALSFLEEVRADAGLLLMNDTFESESVAYVVEGELEVRVDGHLVGFVGAGEWVGETALFPDSTRRATVLTRTDVWLLVLPTEAYVALRRGGHPLVPILERDLLAQQLDRLRRLGEAITQATKNAARQRPGPGVFARLGALFGAGGLLSLKQDVDVAHELRQLGIVDDEATDRTAEGVAAPFVAQSVPAGTLLCTEGERGDAMYVLLRGAVEVVRAKGEDGVAELAHLEPGAAFGLAALHERKPRMASCIASAPSTVLRLERAGWDTLVQDEGPVGSTFRRAMIEVLSTQLAHANRSLVEHGAAKATGEFEGGLPRPARGA